MTTAKLTLVAAAALFALATLGVATTWTGGFGSILLLIAATSAAVAMEARDFAEGHPALEGFLEDVEQGDHRTAA